MSHFLDEQAEESENDNDSVVSDAEPVAKRPKKQKRKQISSDEEDEDELDDDARLKEEMRDFVVEEGDEEGEGNSDGDDDDDDDQSDRRGGSDAEDLLEDDLDLVNENTGINVGGRVEISDDESLQDDRERIKDDLFGHDDFDGEEVQERNRQQALDDYGDDDSRSESEQSEDNAFIVQDDDRGDRRRKKHGKSGFRDQYLDEAKDIFGVEDIDDFYDDEEVEDEGEEGEEGMVPVRQKANKVSLWSTIEPSELAKGFISAADKRIIFDDRPERFQTRRIPVTEADDSELSQEKEWIYTYAFCERTISKQDRAPSSSGAYGPDVPNKIGEALRFIRNQLYEVPFIAFYRKEHIENILISDLWKIYEYDEKWCRLKIRQKRLNDLLSRVERYIQNVDFDETQKPLRKVSEADFMHLNGVQTAEELSDAYAHFQLYYGNEMKKVQEFEQRQEEQHIDTSAIAPKFKLGSRTDKYLLCVQCGLDGMAKHFGLTPAEMAENFIDYVKHDVRQNPVEPLVVAKEFVCENFPTPEDVLKGAVYVLAQQFSREFGVRRKLRQKFYERLKFSVYPTKKGRDEIDENHPFWNKHYIKDKPVYELVDDDYLKYTRGKNDGLLEVKLYTDTDQDIANKRTLLDECFLKEPIFQRDEFYYVVEEWNKLRREVLDVCVNEILMPIFQREAHEKLIEEAQKYVLAVCAENLSQRLAIESYKPTFRYMNDTEDEISEDVGVRVMSICYSSDQADASFALVVDQDGAVLEHQRLVHLTKMQGSRNPHESALKAKDMDTLQKLILRRQPHIIGINGEDLIALRIREDVSRLVKKMIDDNELQNMIPIEITNNDVAKVFMNSQMSQSEFPEYPPLLRQAVSLARYILDPLIEICHLCNADDEILFIKFHSLQSEVPKRELLFALHVECINRVNEVGVDINRCLEYPHTAGLLQFVCGLGPRKASNLMKMLKQKDNLLESRTKLVTLCQMGPKVFMNASGFIKIDTAKVSERTDAYVEVLDGSRVHPETYEWARKMAVDALEIDDPADPTGALEEILQYPDRLRDLDLDAFAEELARQNFGNKSITLYDIRAELNYRYKDLRAPRQPLEGQELFEQLVKDSTTSLEGKLVIGRVLYIVHRKPNEKDQGNPKHNAEKNTWECGFCRRADFLGTNDVWTHTDKGQCPGVPVGAKIRLDNGLIGFVGIKNISDNIDSARNPGQRLIPGRDQMFRVLSFNTEKMQVELSCKTSDLQRPVDDIESRDPYFDKIRFEDDIEQREKMKAAQQVRSNFVKRVISHPSFHNVTFKDAERMLRNMEPGEVVVRPSAKSANYLTITWKVAGNIYQHINIREEQKEKVYDIGKALFINQEQFEDLDEIIARHVQPMAGFAQDIMSYKYYMEDVYSEEIGAIEAYLHEEKKRAPTRIPYTLTASSKYPGKFVLSYLAQQKVRHEYVSATPDGIKFRYQLFSTTDELINWFKMNYMHRPEIFKK